MTKFLKALIAVFILAAITSATRINENLPENTRLATLAKVWGFIKYYHSNVASGNLDWDSVLVATIPQILESKTKQSFNRNIENLLEVAGKLEISRNNTFLVSDTLELMVDYDWLFSRSVLTKELTRSLEKIKNAGPVSKNVYIDVDVIPSFNEKPVPIEAFPNEEVQLLALFRYWNAIYYFYPYKDLMDKSWEDGLLYFIPKFREVHTAEQYMWCIREINAYLNDGHSGIQKRPNNRFGVDYNVPLRLEYFDGSTLVSNITSDSLMNGIDIRIGDEIIKKDNFAIVEIRDSLSQYFQQSTTMATNRFINGIILMSKNQTVNLKIRRGRKEFQVTVPTFHVERRVGLNRSKQEPPTWKLLDVNIGYVNISRLEKSQIHGMMIELTDTRAIILDQRRYPRSGTVDTLMNRYLSPKASQFSLIKIPNPKIAGTYYYMKYYIGPKNVNQNYYQGRIVVLAGENTGSAAEFNVMKLQTLPNVITVGRQTTGSDGNVVTVSLPGYLRARHSGIGIYYPDTTQTQRVGVRIDKYVERTWEDLLGKQDQILETALETINKN